DVALQPERVLVRSELAGATAGCTAGVWFLPALGARRRRSVLGATAVIDTGRRLAARDLAAPQSVCPVPRRLRAGSAQAAAFVDRGDARRRRPCLGPHGSGGARGSCRLADH